jgi:hypothetical protein
VSTQKQKFELFARLQALGFTYEESAQLRRIEMTLHRWGEQECGDSNSICSFGIERDETTGKPFKVVSYHHESKTRRYPIADREKGALKRLQAVLDARNLRETTDNEAGNFIIPHHQTDPRGCALYLLTRADIPAGSSLDSVYTRGLAVCA